MNRARLYRSFIPLAFLGILFIVWNARRPSRDAVVVELGGITMGKIAYKVKYLHPAGLNLQREVDSLLQIWNQALSTYIPDSEISRFNRDSCHSFESPWFLPVLRASSKVYHATGGAFDPTVGPLVNAWGFGPDEPAVLDSATVDRLRNTVGFDKLSFDDRQVCKHVTGLKLDFSAVAKGYAVDVLGEFLEGKGVRDYLVDIGGELLCKGRKEGGKLWRTAIEDPTVEVFDQRIYAIVDLSDRAVATSGNYRNYYIRDGVRYVHTIDPSTGYPIVHSLLSATVFAADCMSADAFATGFMVLGLEKSIEVLDRNPHIDAYLIYNDADGSLRTYATLGIADHITVLEDEN
jgi:FAD:protein FMN transferase